MLNRYSIIVNFFKKIRLSLGVATLCGLAVFYFLFYSEIGEAPKLSEHLDKVLWSIGTALTCGLGLTFSNAFLNKRLPWNNSTNLRLVVELLSNLTTITIIIGLLGYLYLQLKGWVTSDFLDQRMDMIIKLLVITLVIILIYSVINFALYSYHYYTYAQIERTKNQRKYLELQFDVLKSQLSPHYLFNCLNTISSLVFKDATMAEDFIRRLATTYQYILRNNKKKFVTLAEEIDFVKSYNYLLKVRFESNLSIDINLPPNIMQTKIPPITLQMLIENAVKHNVITKDKPLHIYITAQDNTSIKVMNSKTSTPAGVDSFKVGITNIEQRYAYLTDKKIRVQDGEKYMVTLPVIKPNLIAS